MRITLRNFEFVKLESLAFDLNAETSESGRVYATPTGEKYPSITTVLSSFNKKALFEWRKRVGEEEANRIAAKASRRGTKLHTVCENYLLGELTGMKMQTMMPDTKELFMQLQPAIDANVGKVYGLEQALYSHKLRLAGRCDCIAEWDGKLSIIDYKSASREKSEDGILNYFMQCSAYAEMFEEVTGMPIDQIVVAIAVEGGQPQIFRKSKAAYIEPLNEYIGKYWNKA
jgi:ATP-dependent exoDNAse (exonuclease V) beta subunit